jgi:hypothetical protein
MKGWEGMILVCQMAEFGIGNVERPCSSIKVSKLYIHKSANEFHH